MAAPVYILQNCGREKNKKTKIIYMLLFLSYMQQRMFHSILLVLQDTDLCIFRCQNVKPVPMYLHMTEINPL